MKLDIKFDSNLADMKKVIEMGGVQSMSRAINDALAKGKTSLANNITDVYTIKKKDILPNTRLVKCYPGDLKKGKIVVQSRRFTSVHFSFTPRKYISQKATVDESGKKKRAKKYVASLTVKKGGKVKIPHAFVVDPNCPKLKGESHVLMLWKRYMSKKDGEEKITPIRSISVAQMAKHDKVYDPSMTVIQKYYEERLVRHLNRQFKVEE